MQEWAPPPLVTPLLLKPVEVAGNIVLGRLVETMHVHFLRTKPIFCPLDIRDVNLAVYVVFAIKIERSKLFNILRRLLIPVYSYQEKKLKRRFM